ncbi:hypothetical protein GQR58_030352 [Nymphon striatum]|nr:hypothetical protein GQR58_030352 [Nymphon striatum]
MFRCARGSTSLESFHLHINRFIPVIVFNSPPQLSAAMTGLGAPGPRSYNLRMHHALRKMSIEVLGAILRRHTLRPVSRTPRAEPCTEPSYDAIPLRPLSRAERSYDAIPLRPVSRTPRAEPCTELVTYDAIPLRPLSRAERSLCKCRPHGRHGRSGQSGPHLVSLTLESQSRAMTDVQATEVIRLWDSLSAHDRLPTKFPARYRTERLVGRFKRAKAQLAPGVESVRRCFTGGMLVQRKTRTVTATWSP